MSSIIYLLIQRRLKTGVRNPRSQNFLGVYWDGLEALALYAWLLPYSLTCLPMKSLQILRRAHRLCVNFSARTLGEKPPFRRYIRRVLSRHPSRVMLIGLDSWHAKNFSANQDLSCRSPHLPINFLFLQCRIL